MWMRGFIVGRCLWRNGGGREDEVQQVALKYLSDPLKTQKICFYPDLITFLLSFFSPPLNITHQGAHLPIEILLYFVYFKKYIMVVALECK